jgi:hypothetical protein
MSDKLQTEFDLLEAIRASMERKVIFANLLIVLIAVASAYYFYQTNITSFIHPFILFPATALLAFIVAPHILDISSHSYNKKRYMLKKLYEAIEKLQIKSSKFYSSIPRRPRGRHFKSHYELANTTIDDFENRLAVGMWHEQREVWVTAFCNNGRVLRVTATIGSEFTCRPSDNLSSWIMNARRLGCTELRQYHNHLVNNNATRPSPIDLMSSKALEKEMEIFNISFKSYIIYWNKILEYKILEYRSDGTSKISKVFDVMRYN